jgi:hypothetical protein
VEKAWNGLSTMAVHEDGFLGYVQNVGKEPKSSQPVTYETTADFGVGAFLLAGTEVFKMARGEWIDPPEPEENIALGGLAAYSGQQVDNPAVNATDGNVLNRWSAEYFPQWIEINLGDMYYLKRTEIVPYKNRAYQYLIYGKANPEDAYSVLIDRLENQDGGTILTDTINYGPVRYLKLAVTGCYEYTGDWVSIMEFKAYGDIYGLGINQVEKAPVRLFPNPASDFIDIEFSSLSGNNLQVEIIDLQGKPVYSSTWSSVLPGSSCRITEISKFEQGLYLIIITNGDQQTVKKLMIK